LIIITGKHVCITGGSQGIGLWVAINAAKKGADITIIARNTKILGMSHLIFKLSLINK
jgi:3-dehydrosphinganine reductase